MKKNFHLSRQFFNTGRRTARSVCFT